MNKVPLPLKLNEEQWAHIKPFIDLHDDLRYRLNYILGFAKYDHEIEFAITQPALLKQDLVATRAKAEALLYDLRKIVGIKDTETGTDNAQPDIQNTEVGQFQLLMALISPAVQQKKAGRGQKKPTVFVLEPPPRLIALRALDRYIKALESLIMLFKAAEERIQKAKTGNKTKSAHVLAEELDKLVKKDKKGVRKIGLKRGSTASEGFIEACFEIVEFKQTPDAVLRAITPKLNGKVAPQKK